MIAPPPTPKRPARIPVSPPARISAAASGRKFSSGYRVMSKKRGQHGPRFNSFPSCSTGTFAASGRRRRSPEFRPGIGDHRPEGGDQSKRHDGRDEGIREEYSKPATGA